MIQPGALTVLVIDLPDERSGIRRQFDHMHAWGRRDEMEAMKRMLEDHFGSGRDHMLIDGTVCPHCGETPPRGRL